MKVKIWPRMGLSYGVGALYRPLNGSRTQEMDSNQSGAVEGIIWGPFQGSLNHLGAPTILEFKT